MTANVFIDGEIGTTGLQIRARLEARGDIELLSLPSEARKNPLRRAEMLNSADLAILCLPDDAAREAAAMIENPAVRVIDASTAHRTHADWVYGFPEYEAGQAERIAAARRVTNPGCYALASIALIHPLIAAGLLPPEHPVTINAVSGYSGGGRKLIERFEDAGAADHIAAPFRVYALGLAHKHVPEIQARGGLATRPLFVPSVGRFRQGMIVQVPLHLGSLPGRPDAAALHAVFARHYEGRRFVEVVPLAETLAMDHLDPEGLNGTNGLRLHVFANEAAGQVVLAGLLDNLGKGASGQAVQNLNLMLGRPEDAGLAPRDLALEPASG
ncbi:MAG: N-acetyl-gamma-glutamyl-phosphate reductase [Rhodospirillales bacterium]|nr:N-acetyl-gamma-glutamyl-phosphate reductase [Rhodospirillales bacterium]